MIELNQQDVQLVSGGSEDMNPYMPPETQTTYYSLPDLGSPSRSLTLLDPEAEFLGYQAFYIA